MININIGLDMLLTIIFVILKLTHIIAWSWLWVLSPIWIMIICIILAELFL